MCTVIVSVDPATDVPVLLVGLRDEFSGRPWLPPARHWPDRPELVGGRDLQAGGAWLAVNTLNPAVACVLNGVGRPAPERGRLSRGELPLLLASGGSLGTLLLDHFDPFHAVHADADTVSMWSWDGLELVSTTLDKGLHMVVNSGLEPTGEMAARVGYFQPRLQAAPRPFSPGQDGWEPWLSLVDGDGLDPADPRAMVLRREISDGHFWGTSSISLVALGRDSMRLHFSGHPGSGHFAEVPLD
ncbi:MAG TPA: NRDE family protein [Candidatus Limnocylindrales bacterium]|nr:NRDE family protein [Candidatus Limnocylindrales bacterium]